MRPWPTVDGQDSLSVTVTDGRLTDEDTWLDEEEVPLLVAAAALLLAFSCILHCILHCLRLRPISYCVDHRPRSASPRRSLPFIVLALPTLRIEPRGNGLISLLHLYCLVLRQSRCTSFVVRVPVSSKYGIQKLHATCPPHHHLKHRSRFHMIIYLNFS